MNIIQLKVDLFKIGRRLVLAQKLMMEKHGTSEHQTYVITCRDLRDQIERLEELLASATISA
jgi:hypothetical protein